MQYSQTDESHDLWSDELEEEDDDLLDSLLFLTFLISGLTL